MIIQPQPTPTVPAVSVQFKGRESNNARLAHRHSTERSPCPSEEEERTQPAHKCGEQGTKAGLGESGLF